MRCPECRPQEQDGGDGAGHCEHGAFEDVALASVAELVRDDHLQLRVVGVSQQRVPDDEPASRSEPGDVGVRLDGSPARVGDENGAQRDAGVVRELAQRSREVLVGERLEAVEERLEQQRREQGEDQHGERRADGGRGRPPARQPTGERDERRPGGSNERDGDHDGFRVVGQPGAGRLRREAPAPFP